MKRSVSVTVVAILSLLGSVLTLMMGALMAVSLLITGRSPQALEQSIALIGVLVGTFMLVIPALWGIATAIGLLFLKRWARLSILVFSVLLVLMSVFAAPAILFVPMPPTPGADPHVFTHVCFAMAGFYALLAAVGVWWFVLFIRPSVREQFGAYTTGGTNGIDYTIEIPGRPISISIIGWLFIVGAAIAPLNLWFRPPVPFFWGMLTGWPASLYSVIYAVIALYVGIGLLRLNPLCRTMAIYLYCFAGVNAAFFYFAPGRQVRFRAMMNWMPPFLPHTEVQLPTTFVFVGGLMGIGVIGLLMYFLLTSKPAFDRARLQITG